MDLKVIEESYRNQLINSLVKMRRNEQMCDVKLLCGSTLFPVHSCILAAASPYFKSLFDSQHEENITVPTDSHTMTIFLDYMYTGIFAFDPSNLVSCLIAAHLFQLNPIYKYCFVHVEKIINFQNYSKLWKAAEKCNDKELQDVIIKYSCQNIDKLIESKNIGKCSVNQIKNIATSQILSPEVTMQSVMVWLQQDPVNRKPYLQSLWTEIALPTPTVVNIFDKELFVKSPDFVTSIKNIMSLENVGDKPNQNQNETLNEEKANTPPLPPRRKSTLSRASSNPSPFQLQPAQIPKSTTIFFNNIPPIDTPDVAAPEPPPRSVSRSVSMANDERQLLIFAVTRHKSIALQKYNLQTKTWSASEDFPLPKQYAIPPVITALDDQIYILGGALSSIDFDSSVYVTSIFEYARREMCSMLLPRVHFGVTNLNGLIYVIGGRNRTGWLRDVERFNPEQNVWHQMAPLSEPKSALAVTAVQGRIYVIGGLKGTKLFSTTTESYDPLLDQWTQVEPLPLGRYRVGIAALNNNIHVLGGAIELPQFRDNFLVYDIEENVWKNVESPDTFKDDQPCMVTWNNKLWIISRKNYSLFTYDPLTYSWDQLDTSAATRHWQYIKTILLVSL